MGKVARSLAMTQSEWFEFEIVVLDAQGQVISRQIQQRSRYRETLATSLDLEMVAVPGGTLLMGAPPGEIGSTASQRPQHRVAIAPFWLGRYPITQAQWLAVAKPGRPDRPLAADERGHQRGHICDGGVYQQYQHYNADTDDTRPILLDFNSSLDAVFTRVAQPANYDRWLLALLNDTKTGLDTLIDHSPEEFRSPVGGGYV